MMHGFFFLFWSFTTLFQHTCADCVQCSSEQPTIAAPFKNIWLPLSQEELSGVSDVLQQKLNVSTSPDPSGQDNYILRIELLHPNKSDVLPFIQGDAGAPKRYARASVQYGSSNDPYRQEYIVGPLPATNITSTRPLTYSFNNETPGKTSIASIYAGDLASFFSQFAPSVDDIAVELWNTTILEGGFGPRLGSVISEENGSEFVWVTFLGPETAGFNSLSILPLGVFVRFDVTGTNWKNWKATAWYYRGKFYENTDDFREAVFSPGFKKPPQNVDGPWTSTDKQGDPMPLDDLAPPITTSQGKRRFSIDFEENFVSWMDFTLFMSTSTDQALSLFNINYKGRRILYELSLQEALAHYAGSDPVMSETLYFDTQDGMGASLVPLINGYDCPSHATYVNATYTTGTEAVTVPNAICLFESDANYPIRRHSTPTYTSVTKNIIFTIRTISAVGNYDYLIEYNFFLDGAIEVSVRASGYISAAYAADNEEYGFHIHDFLSGSLHDHVLTFKADFDIFGENNSVQKVEVVPDTIVYPWSEGKSRNTMKIVKSLIDSESDASINWEQNDPVIYAIVNTDAENKFGEFPGYRIKRAAGTSHLTMEHSSNAGKAAHYATKDLFVTKQKDIEPRLADRYNDYNIDDPLVDFSKFLDGESLDQEDLVLWFNLGMHHIPHTGDLANTLMTSAHSAIRLEPLNYLYSDPSRASSWQIKINSTDGSIERFGSQDSNCSVDLSTLNEFNV